MKVGALPTQAKAGALSLCSSVKKLLLPLQSAYIQRLKTIDIDSSDVGGAAGGWS